MELWQNKKMRLLAIVLSIFIIFPSGVYSSDTLYCLEEESTGFYKEENKEYEITDFILERFSIKFSDDSFSNLTISRDKKKENYTCTNEEVFLGSVNKFSLHCNENSDVAPYLFLYSVEKKRFTYFRGSIFGYPLEGGDSTVLSIGSCDDF